MSLLGPVEAFLAEDGWACERDDAALRVEVEGGGARWTCVALALPDGDRLVLYGVVPEPCPPDRLAAMAEFVARANAGLALGNFELDYADGSMRFKTSIDVAGDRLSVALVRTLFYSNAAVMHRYLPGIAAVVAGTAPLAAVAGIEA